VVKLVLEESNRFKESNFLEGIALACVGMKVDAILKENPKKIVEINGKKYEFCCSLDGVGEGIHRESFILFMLNRTFFICSTHYAKALKIDYNGKAVELMADEELESFGVP